jgi:hypothetical protein
VAIHSRDDRPQGETQLFEAQPFSAHCDCSGRVETVHLDCDLVTHLLAPVFAKEYTNAGISGSADRRADPRSGRAQHEMVVGDRKDNFLPTLCGDWLAKVIADSCISLNQLVYYNFGCELTGQLASVSAHIRADLAIGNHFC